MINVQLSQMLFVDAHLLLRLDLPNSFLYLMPCEIIQLSLSTNQIRIMDIATSL